MRNARSLRGLAAMMLTGMLALTVLPAPAHTHIVIAGFQIAPGGTVNGYGQVGNVNYDEGPASDGTVIWHNLDPVTHRLVECRPCGANPQVASNPAFDVRIDPGEEATVYLPLGSYTYFDPAYPTMRGKVRVTAQEG